MGILFSKLLVFFDMQWNAYDLKIERKIIKNIQQYHKSNTIGKLFCCRKYNKIRAKNGVNIWPGIEIGSNLRIVHCQNITIGQTTKIGNNCVIYQNVQIIAKVKNDNICSGRRHATVGDNVVIGAGATIIGNVTIGDDVFIGANALITKNIPSHTVCYGINTYREKAEIEKNSRWLNGTDLHEGEIT